MADALTFSQLPSRALIAVAGPDWRSFLQGLISQDVESLRPGEARFGGLLTPQGRLLYDLFVVGREEGCWLDVAAEHRTEILQRLTMYRLRANVEISASELPVAAAFGPGTPHAGFVADPRLPALGWRAYGAVVEGSEQTYDAHRLALGVPGPADWGCDKTFPIEADFDLLNGIDFHKGCYVGQETTSRMKRRGQIKSRMLPITFTGEAPARGAEILAGELRVGEVLSGAHGRAIALVRLDRIENASLTVEGRPISVEHPAWIPLTSPIAAATAEGGPPADPA